jgi:hypothetical protein
MDATRPTRPTCTPARPRFLKAHNAKYRDSERVDVRLTSRQPAPLTATREASNSPSRLRRACRSDSAVRVSSVRWGNPHCKRQACPPSDRRPAGATAEWPQISDGRAAGASQRSSSLLERMPFLRSSCVIRAPSMTYLTPVRLAVRSEAMMVIKSRLLGWQR